MAKTNPPKVDSQTPTIVTVLLLVFLPLIGVVVMWFWPKWPLWLKLLITILLGLFLFLIGIFLAIVLVTINPGEIKKSALDTTRISDVTKVVENINKMVSSEGDKLKLCGEKPEPCSFSSDTSPDNWVPFKLSSSDPLPVDPVNKEPYVYTYCSDGKNFEIDSQLSSSRLEPQMSKDGGDNNQKYEMGSDLTLCK